MTWEQRVSSVSRQGFTTRQAAFLVHVMLHAGVCVGRQYCAFVGRLLALAPLLRVAQRHLDELRTVLVESARDVQVAVHHRGGSVAAVPR